MKKLTLSFILSVLFFGVLSVCPADDAQQGLLQGWRDYFFGQSDAQQLDSTQLRMEQERREREKDRAFRARSDFQVKTEQKLEKLREEQQEIDVYIANQEQNLARGLYLPPEQLQQLADEINELAQRSQEISQELRTQMKLAIPGYEHRRFAEISEGDISAQEAFSPAEIRTSKGVEELKVIIDRGEEHKDKVAELFQEYAQAQKGSKLEFWRAFIEEKTEPILQAAGEALEAAEENIEEALRERAEEPPMVSDDFGDFGAYSEPSSTALTPVPLSSDQQRALQERERMLRKQKLNKALADFKDYERIRPLLRRYTLPQQPKEGYSYPGSSLEDLRQQLKPIAEEPAEKETWGQWFTRMTTPAAGSSESTPSVDDDSDDDSSTNWYERAQEPKDELEYEDFDYAYEGA